MEERIEDIFVLGDGDAVSIIVYEGKTDVDYRGNIDIVAHLESFLKAR